MLLKGPEGLIWYTAVNLSHEGNETVILTFYRILEDDPSWMDIVMEHRTPIEDFWVVPEGN